MIGWAILIQYCRGLSMAAAPFDWSSINFIKNEFLFAIQNSFYY